MKTPRDLITIPAAAAMLGRHHRTVRTWIAEGKLAAWRVGDLRDDGITAPGGLRVSRADVQAKIQPVTSAKSA